MSPRVAVVTGSNKGIGFAIVKALCSQFDGVVYLTARDEERGKAAVQELEKSGLSPKFHQLDITKEASIQNLASYLKEKYGGLDVLVNNAAIAYKNKDPAPFSEQAANTVRVNFYATLNVCNVLFPLLKPHARVVNVSSCCGMVSQIPKGEMYDKFEKRGALTEGELSQLMDAFVEDAAKGVHSDKWGNSAYSVSKVGVTALTFVQDAAFREDSREDIVINAVHPGYVDTDMSSHKGHLTPDQGAVAAVYLALLPPNVGEPRGKFVWHDKTVRDWTSDWS